MLCAALQFAPPIIFPRHLRSDFTVAVLKRCLAHVELGIEHLTAVIVALAPDFETGMNRGRDQHSVWNVDRPQAFAMRILAGLVLGYVLYPTASGMRANSFCALYPLNKGKACQECFSAAVVEQIGPVVIKVLAPTRSSISPFPFTHTEADPGQRGATYGDSCQCRLTTCKEKCRTGHLKIVLSEVSTECRPIDCNSIASLRECRSSKRWVGPKTEPSRHRLAAMGGFDVRQRFGQR